MVPVSHIPRTTARMRDARVRVSIHEHEYGKRTHTAVEHDIGYWVRGTLIYQVYTSAPEVLAAGPQLLCVLVLLYCCCRKYWPRKHTWNNNNYLVAAQSMLISKAGMRLHQRRENSDVRPPSPAGCWLTSLAGTMADASRPQRRILLTYNTHQLPCTAVVLLWEKKCVF